MKNQVQLITYVDRLSGGGLRDLTALLAGPLEGLFGGVHVLPFYYPIDGADAGFDPIDHTQVDPRLGRWKDLQALCEQIPVMADVIVNHLSIDSPQFQDFSLHGAASKYAGLFLTLDTVFPAGATEADLLAVYRPQPGLPLVCAVLKNGEQRILWSSFAPQQLDINVEHPQGQAYLRGILHTLAHHGVKMVRLDAVGYAIKRPGRSCFMMAETYQFIADFAAQARALGLAVLVEIHGHYQTQIEIASRVDWVYDFALPPLVLHGFGFKTAGPLKAWLRVRPNNALTVLDTHDGIGMIDIGADSGLGRPGLVPPNELAQLVEMIHTNCQGQSRQATGAAAANLDLHQVNCTFYEALGRNNRQYLLARALQFFMPGVPQVYYVGFLAGLNDLALLAKTGVGRDINRSYFDRPALLAALQQPVVVALLALIRHRNQHPAFAGQFSCAETADTVLCLRWQAGSEWSELTVDFETGTGSLAYSDAGAVKAFGFD